MSSNNPLPPADQANEAVSATPSSASSIAQVPGPAGPARLPSRAPSDISPTATLEHIVASVDKIMMERPPRPVTSTAIVPHTIPSNDPALPDYLPGDQKKIYVERLADRTLHIGDRVAFYPTQVTIRDSDNQMIDYAGGRSGIVLSLRNSAGQVSVRPTSIDSKYPKNTLSISPADVTHVRNHRVWTSGTMDRRFSIFGSNISSIFDDPTFIGDRLNVTIDNDPRKGFVLRSEQIADIWLADTVVIETKGQSGVRSSTAYLVCGFICPNPSFRSKKYEGTGIYDTIEPNAWKVSRCYQT